MRNSCPGRPAPCERGSICFLRPSAYRRRINVIVELSIWGLSDREGQRGLRELKIQNWCGGAAAGCRSVSWRFISRRLLQPPMCQDFNPTNAGAYRSWPKLSRTCSRRQLSFHKRGSHPVRGIFFFEVLATQGNLRNSLGRVGRCASFSSSL